MSHYPVIIIPGIGQSKLVINDENGNRIKTAWPFELDEKELMNTLKGDLMKLLLFKKDGGFSDKIAKIVADIADPLSLNDDGSKKHNVVPVSFNKSVAECSEDEKRFIYKMIPFSKLGEKIGEENLFFFAYDPFGDIFDTANSLRKFVMMVKEKTGSEKVSFVPVSIGGVVFKAYLSLFGDENDIGMVVNLVSASLGASVVADILENAIDLSQPVKFLASLGGKAESIASMAGMLPEEVIRNIANKAIDTIRSMLAEHCTTIWGAIPESRFDAIYNAKAEKGSVFEQKVSKLHSFDFIGKLKELFDSGVGIYSLAGCGDYLPEVLKSKDVETDTIVDTTSASLNGIFPDTTWYFNKLGHNSAAKNEQFVSLAEKILAGEITGVCSEYPSKIG